MREPVLLSIIGMREALQACDFDEAKVNLICKNVENHGKCSMGAGDGLARPPMESLSFAFSFSIRAARSAWGF
ncbi:hypothetical protein [Pararhizobium sp. PWRC1-1]|uniref:hypothetical protein n=1 Tax=Pararhizobium sp. PWRC1-1 TaxID=2804566 RepID=UPI003CE91C1F